MRGVMQQKILVATSAGFQRTRFPSGGIRHNWARVLIFCNLSTHFWYESSIMNWNGCRRRNYWLERYVVLEFQAQTPRNYDEWGEKRSFVSLCVTRTCPLRITSCGNAGSQKWVYSWNTTWQNDNFQVFHTTLLTANLFSKHIHVCADVLLMLQIPWNLSKEPPQSY